MSYYFTNCSCVCVCVCGCLVSFVESCWIFFEPPPYIIYISLISHFLHPQTYTHTHNTQDGHAPWSSTEESKAKPTSTDDEIRTTFLHAIQKRMMADVDYGFFLSGGVDSAVVSNVLLPLYKEAKRMEGGGFVPIPTVTVGMKNSLAFVIKGDTQSRFVHSKTERQNKAPSFSSSYIRLPSDQKCTNP